MTPRTEAGGTAIILSGGLGSRLGALAADLPKPMLPVGGRPFVEYIVICLARAAFSDIIFATGHRSEALRDHFGNGERWGVSIRYSHETEPLGTGGAIKRASGATADDPLLVVNGDSYLDIDPRLVLDAVRDDVVMTVALARAADARRFGRVKQSPDGKVVQFAQDDASSGPASINAGIYGLRRQVLDGIPPGRFVSLEQQILPNLAGRGLLGVNSGGYFVDIGVPDAYLGLVANPEPLLAAVGIHPLR